MLKISPALKMGAKLSERGRNRIRDLGKLFFFEKKNQKTFVPFLRSGQRRRRCLTDKRLFASFSSEKEDSTSLLTKIFLPLLAVFALAGCDHGGNDVAQTFGGLVDVPFEFEVTTRTPLEMPKTDNLVPPNPEASGPPQQSLRQQAEAVLAPQLALAASAAAKPSAGEEALLKAAGPPAPKNIRVLVDNSADERSTARGLSDVIDFWRPRAQPVPETLDAAAEAARIKAAKASGKSLTDGPIPILKAQNPGLFQGLF
ncbi:DUF3035 domain-containing protein [Acidibrevibacterium fodinaquatile]|uniref:DUF3035 domain-containing protein n=1 Tax=Acidibrevibacterium fodinaquatile TaxID=1969806 RepID=UPI0013B3BD82|nr:DUF3035 domain-containing protein [Acidibrevibacterium fodinaquatile]